MLLLALTCAADCQFTLAQGEKPPQEAVAARPQKIEAVVDDVVPAWEAPHPSVSVRPIVGDVSDANITFNLYNSAFSDGVIYRDNCVATPSDRIIDCDLKLVDDLIRDFKLIEIFGGSTADFDKGFYRRNILEWVLAHEVGHIALKHGISDFDEWPRGESVFHFAQQQKELAADAFAINVIGNLSTGPVPAYQAVIDISNALIRKSLCPQSFPKLCSKIPLGGVGLDFDYTATAEPIRIPLSGSHPAFVARFLRILYLAGVGTTENSISYLAKEAIDHLLVQGGGHEWTTLRKALSRQ